MVNTITKEEITTLLWFRLSETCNSDALTIDVQSLLDGEMEKYLRNVMVEIGAPNEKIAASIMMKRYAFFACLALFTMSHSDRQIDVNTNNIKLVSHYEDGHWLPKFYLKKLSLDHFTGSRNQWREQYVKAIFANHIYLLMDKLTEMTKISKLILWENIAVYIFWLYENVLNDDKSRKELIEEDFRYLLHEAPGEVFGPYHQNPLTKYDSKKIFNSATEKYIRIRKTCCFSYQLHVSGKRCSTCPCFQGNEEGGCQSEQSYCSTIRSVND